MTLNSENKETVLLEVSWLRFFLCYILILLANVVLIRQFSIDASIEISVIIFTTIFIFYALNSKEIVQADGSAYIRYVLFKHHIDGKISVDCKTLAFVEKPFYFVIESDNGKKYKFEKIMYDFREQNDKS